MKLSTIALQNINKTPIRLKLALELGCTERWISRLIKDNETDSDLTKASAVRVIREETGMVDTDILEQEPVNEGTK